ncbi:hypothetical protein BTJ68_09225 [Hortaea werneckii EXF-2000]|uniref:AB hydrolase-1 domain-containing protein n=1 Tax=Hortaea werneckii EXF-2000 TaxID=1157616 RepID=A0A1Z5T789_HORWE|nr:hypothetical protein BTJ68_09225 [Hortaea werneckii EXF-2000]
MGRDFLLCCLAWLSASTAAQDTLQSQNSTWNSTLTLTDAQIRAANLSAETVQNVEVAVNYERTNQPGGSIEYDDFYTLPDDYDYANPPKPGFIIKIEEHTNTTFYTLPRRSQFLAFSYPHGTSGFNRACAPSHLRGLWDSVQEPFTMSLQGYAVVAPDYAGLGVPNVTSPYFVLPAQANDLFRAMEAAQKTWPHLLSREFAKRPVQGYLGTVAASPFLDVLDNVAGEGQAQVNGRISAIAQGLGSVYPGFEPGQWLTEAGLNRLELLTELQGCNAVSSALFSAENLTVPILKDGWEKTEAAKWWNSVASNGEDEVQGPMLVIQGMEDGNAIVNVTTQGVQETCERFPDTRLQYVIFEGLGHVPVLYGGQHIWLDWIAERFRRVSVERRCGMETVAPVRGVENIVPNQNWFISYNVYGV